jgi:hypothetical protein
MAVVFSGVLRSKTPQGQTAGKEAGCKDFQVFALQKPKAKKWHGRHFLAAQGIGAEFLRSKNWSG